MTQQITVVESLDDLRLRVQSGKRSFAILLAGGAAFSKKTIQTRPGGRWYVKNHIDNTSQTLTDSELWTESNIGIALDNRALVQLNGRGIRGSAEA